MARKRELDVIKVVLEYKHTDRGIVHWTEIQNRFIVSVAEAKSIFADYQRKIKYQQRVDARRITTVTTKSQSTPIAAITALGGTLDTVATTGPNTRFHFA